MRIVPALLLIATLSGLSIETRAQKGIEGVEEVRHRLLQALTTRSYSAFIDTMRKNAGSWEKRRLFGPEDTLLCRRLESGLREYITTFTKELRIYAAEDTIVYLRFSYDDRKPEVLLCDSLYWKRWEQQVAIDNGVDLEAPIDSISLPDYIRLSDRSSCLRYGFLEGLWLSVGEYAARTLACRGKADVLRRILYSPNIEGRIFALEALTALRESGVNIKVDLEEYRVHLRQLNPILRLCDGDFYTVDPIAVILDHPFELSDYFDYYLMLGVDTADCRFPPRAPR